MNEEEFLGWLEHPVTKALRQMMRNRVDLEKDRWASGAFTDQSQFGTAILNAKAIGGCEVCELVAGLDYETLVTGLEE